MIERKDIRVKYAKVALEAHNWTPSDYFYFETDVREWICKLGHTWDATVSSRTKWRTGCPYCTNRKVLVGFNDLATTHPHLVEELVDLDPTTVTYGAEIMATWICQLGHDWPALVYDRTKKNATNCPYCSGNKIWIGFNDLATTYPILSTEAYEWNPQTVSAGSGKVRDWICLEKHIWPARISDRAKKNAGCQTCAKRGFKPDKPGYLYIISTIKDNNFTIKFGITNNIETRLREHSYSGFTNSALKVIYFPVGLDAKKQERLIKDLLLKHKVVSLNKLKIKFRGNTEAFFWKHMNQDFQLMFSNLIELDIEEINNQERIALASSL